MTHVFSAYALCGRLTTSQQKAAAVATIVRQHESNFQRCQRPTSLNTTRSYVSVMLQGYYDWACHSQGAMAQQFSTSKFDDDEHFERSDADETRHGGVFVAYGPLADS